jgi:cytochrome P450
MDASSSAEADIFADPEVVANPYPYFDELRSRCPVHPLPHPGVLAVTGYDEAVEIYRDTQSFSSCNAMAGPFPPFEVEPGTDDIAEEVAANREHWVFNEYMVTMDGEPHLAERSLLRRLMTPKRLNENEDEMAGLADRCIDEFVDKGSCEFVAEYANPFTTMVIADLLGVPEEDRNLFRTSAAGKKLAAVGEAESNGSPMPDNPLVYMFGNFRDYIEERRREPREDVLTELATATYPDGSLPSVGAVVRLATFLFGAGQDTSARLMTSSVQILAEHPDLQNRLREERHRIPDFVEEVLRFESPTMSDFRMTQRSTRVADVEVPAGTTIMLHPGAANRDPRRFADPGKFSIDRPNLREHIAFGRGAHICPGSPLARAEGRVTVERILDRISSLRVSESHHGPAGARRYRHNPNYIIRGVKRLHLEFEPIT